MASCITTAPSCGRRTIRCPRHRRVSRDPCALGRGTAPLELSLPLPIQVPTLAVGAYLKNTVALAWDDRAVVSPHIGDLESPRGRAVFAQVAHDLQHLYGVRAERIVHDAHPDFPNTRWARELAATDPARLAPPRTCRGGRR